MEGHTEPQETHLTSLSLSMALHSMEGHTEAQRG